MAALRPPSNVHEVRGGSAVAWCVPAAQAWVQGTLASGGTLYAAAAGAEDVLELRGRGPVYAFAADDGRWVVRRYRRGGAAATLLGERYLRAGAPRPFREMAATDEARKRGIPAVRVLAAAVYREGPFYRGDLVTEYVPGTRDLAALLFGASAPEPGAEAVPAEEDPAVRKDALRDAGWMIARMAGAGVEHPDLNAKNVLLEAREGGPGALLVDLDRVRLRPPAEPLAPDGMRARLERSLRKFERVTGRRLSAAEWDALRAPTVTGSGAA